MVDPPAFLVAIGGGAYTLRNLRYTGLEYSTALDFVNIMGRIRQWVNDNRDRLLILLGLFLVGGLCFEAGFLMGRVRTEVPVVLSVPALLPEEPQKDLVPSIDTSSHLEPVVTVVQEQTTCPFVGSRNSNKYHLATCAVAKRIKLENRICFASREEAEKRGYVASCLK